MLNYIWAGLILIGFLVAGGQDLADAWHNRFANGRDIPVAVRTDSGNIVSLTVSRETLSSMFQLASDEPLVLVGTRDGEDVEVSSPAWPGRLVSVRDFHGNSAGKVRMKFRDGAGAADSSIRWAPIRFVKLRNITDKGIDAAKTAAELAIGLVGGLALWLGLVKIAEDAGLVNVVVRLVRPLIGPLFPGVPRDNPALGLISLNLSANMLALGNAATPIGIKAMQELQKINPRPDVASNAMVMLLAINTAGVTLVPSATVVALMGSRTGVLMMPMLLSTACALAVSIIACFALQRFSPIPAESSSTPTRDA